MIEKIIRFSVQNKIIIGLFLLALIGWGSYSLYVLPIDAVPDITNNQVQIISVAPTLAANEVEQFISAPIEVSVANIPDIVELRSISRLGLSVVTVVFKDNVDIYWARQQITERVAEAKEQIPDGVTDPVLAPISTGLGEIYQYVLHIKPGYESEFNTMELRTIQDWIVRREMLGTPGVADVNSYGGFVKEYEISINPDRLHGMNISLNEIFNALAKNNQNTGSAYIEKKNNAYFVRGIGLISSIEDIENIVVKSSGNGLPILISDVAKVQFGNAPRYGAFVMDTTGEAVGGVVLMLKGKNASEVIAGVKEKIKLIEKSLPEGLEIEPFLDRTDLVNRAVGTVSRNLIEGGLIVIFVLVLLLGNYRAGLVVASVIPLAMLFAISLMNLFGVSGNLMSLGAIDFGLIVDGAVIIVESVVHKITNISGYNETGFKKMSREQMDNKVKLAAKQMMNSATFGQIIILIVYLPILALVGIEGKMFRPMAETVSFAIIGAIILSLTYVPVASALFLSRKTESKKDISDKIMGGIHKAFTPLLNISLKRKISVVVISACLFLLSLVIFNSLGGEFIPQLEEGDLASGIMTLQGGSLSNTIETVKKANRILMTKFPEVKHALCKIGSGEIPTDPTPMETGDYIIVMKDKKEWKSAETREEMMNKMQEELSVLKGVVFTLQQPIQMRFNELMTGSKQDVAVKIFGDNLETMSQSAEKIEKLIKGIPGIEDINIEQVTGSGQIQVIYNRAKIAQYGLSISDINQILKTAFAGNNAGVIYDEEKRFDMVVRFDKDFRSDIQDIKDLYIPLPNGNQIPLDQVAEVSIKNGTAQVSRESTKRRITVSFNVRGRDVESIIDEISELIDKKIKMPPGYYVTYGGQFENLVAAKQRLAIAVPIALLLIFILLFFTFKSIKETLIIYSAVPLSAIGGIFALYLRDMNFSISAGVGFIALFGVAVLNGIVLISEFNRLEWEEGISDIYERVRLGLKTRLRPVIITAAVASLGFLPMVISTSAGAEVQKPLATVVIGGLITATLLTLIVLPVLYILFNTKKKKKNSAAINSVVLVLVVFGFLMFGISNSSYSQSAEPKVYTLEQAINTVLSNNGNVKSASMQVDLQKKLKSSSWDIDKTQVDYVYGQSNSFAKDNNLSVSQSFAFPSVYAFQSKLGKVNVVNSEIGLSLIQSEVVAKIKSNYLLLQFYYSRLKLLNYQDSLYSNFLKAAELRNLKGESTILEKISAQARQMEITTQIQQTSADIEIQLAKLQTLLNEKTKISIAEKELKKVDRVILNDTLEIQKNPDLAFYKNQVEASRVETKIERSKLLPDLTIGYFNQSNKDLDAAYRFSGIQAGVTVPILFFSQASKIQASKIQEQISQNNFEYGQLEIQSEFQTLYQEYLKYKTNVESYEKAALIQSDLIITQAEKEYRAGNIDYIEYLINIDKALEIKTNYLQVLNDYNQSVIAIERFTGKIK
jgi:heavy metal efflux system protein